MDPQSDMKVACGAPLVTGIWVGDGQASPNALLRPAIQCSLFGLSPISLLHPPAPPPPLKARGKNVAKLASRLESQDARLRVHKLAGAPDLATRLGALQAKRALAAAARTARREAKAAAGLVLSDELKARQRVLRRLGYIDEEGLVTTKGRVAADLQVGLGVEV
jgi:hypothetical protein